MKLITKNKSFESYAQRKAKSLYVWRKFCFWRDKSNFADKKARYWLNKHTDFQNNEN